MDIPCTIQSGPWAVGRGQLPTTRWQCAQYGLNTRVVQPVYWPALLTNGVASMRINMCSLEILYISRTVVRHRSPNKYNLFPISPLPPGDTAQWIPPSLQKSSPTTHLQLSSIWGTAAERIETRRWP